MLYKENEFHGFELAVQSLHITVLCYDGSLLFHPVIYSIIGLTRFQGVCVCGTACYKPCIIQGKSRILSGMFSACSLKQHLIDKS